MNDEYKLKPRRRTWRRVIVTIQGVVYDKDAYKNQQLHYRKRIGHNDHLNYSAYL
jgi:hypothetical protein